MEARVILEFRVCQEQRLLPLLVRQEGLPGVMFPILDVLRQVLVLALGQQQDADDADECAAGEDDVVEEVTFLVVELHDGGGQAAKARAGQDQPQPASPASTSRGGNNYTQLSFHTLLNDPHRRRREALPCEYVDSTLKYSQFEVLPHSARENQILLTCHPSPFRQDTPRSTKCKSQFWLPLKYLAPFSSAGRKLDFTSHCLDPIISNTEC